MNTTPKKNTKNVNYNKTFFMTESNANKTFKNVLRGGDLSVD